MVARRVTRRKVDSLAELHAQLKDIEQRYDAEISRLKEAGPAVYDGNHAQIAIQEQHRASIDWPKLAKRYKIPALAIARATRDTPYLAAYVVRKE